jgi:hypothetical protein
MSCSTGLSGLTRRWVHRAVCTGFGVWLGSLLASQGARGADLRFTLPEPARVSLAVYDGAGRQVRSLSAGEPRSAGPHLLAWDGLDREGHPMPPGRYPWRLLANAGLQADLVTVLGINPRAERLDQNPGTEPWTWWVGNHRGPASVAAADGDWYVGSDMTEGAPTTLRLSGDAREQRWSILSTDEAAGPEGSGWGWAGPRAMAVVGDHLVCLAARGHIICKRRVSDGSLVLDAFDHPSEPRRTSFLALSGDRTTPFRDRDFLANPDLDADAERIVVTLPDRNEVRWYATGSGALLRTRRLGNADPAIDPERVGAVARGVGGTTFVVKGPRVLRLADASDEEREFLSPSAGGAPTALAYDRHLDQVLVARGDPGWRIHRYDAGGSEVAVYGVPNGRRNGPYCADAFRRVVDLASDNRGGCYVVEDGLRRVSHVRADGVVDLERFGGTPFFSAASALSDRPAEVWLAMSEDTMVRYQVDFHFDDRPDGDDTASWRVHSVYEISEGGWRLSVGGPDAWRVRRWRGTTWFVHERFCLVLRLDEATHRLLPAASATSTETWSDRNGDGVIDPEERRVTSIHPPLPVGGDHRVHFGPDLSLVLGQKRADGFSFEGRPYVRFPNVAPADSPVPEWDFDRAQWPGFTWTPEPADLDARAVGADAEGGVYLYLRGMQHRSADKHPAPWPVVQGRGSRLACFGPEGARWVVSKHWSHGPAEGAQTRFPAYVPGFVKDCVIVGDRAWYGATAWTRDGLYAGFFLDRHVDDGTPGRNYLPDGWGDADVSFPRGDDWEVGSSVLETAEGRVLWFAPGRNCVAVYRVRGWESWQRMEGSMVLEGPPPAATREGRGLRADYFLGTSMTGPPVATRVSSQIFYLNDATGPVGSIGVDTGNWRNGPADWRQEAGVLVSAPVPGIGANQPFSVRWTGRVTAPLSEPFWFRVYNTYDSGGSSETQLFRRGSGWARLWLNGRLIIDQGSESTPQSPTEAGPILLQAGTSYDLSLEYQHPVGGAGGAQISLAWSSYSLEWTRIPQRYLDPEPGPPLPVVGIEALEREAREAGEEPARVRVSLDAALEQDLTVRYSLNGTASSNDHWPVGHRLIIPRGATSATLAIQPVDDRRMESDESLVVSIDVDHRYRVRSEAGEVMLHLRDNDDPLPEGLALYYPMDETQGLAVPDAAGGRYPGLVRDTLGGSPVSVPRWVAQDGRYRGALEFHGLQETVHVSALPRLDSFTLAFWIRTPDQVAPVLTFKPPGNPCNADLRIYLHDGRIKVSFCGWNIAGGIIADHRWHHVAYRYSNAGLQALSVDGTQVAATTFPTGARLGDWVQLGGIDYVIDTHGYDSFVGFLDEVRLYDRLLAPAEVARLAAHEAAGEGTRFEEWIAGFGFVGVAGNRRQDPDGDGLPNLLEYALGGDPRRADAGVGRLAARRETLAEGELLCVTYPRAVSAGLDYRVEWSLDLRNWGDAAELPGFTEERVGSVSGVSQIQACLPARTLPTVYVRLRVGEVEP